VIRDEWMTPELPLRVRLSDGRVPLNTTLQSGHTPACLSPLLLLASNWRNQVIIFIDLASRE
jgi:hypothetical protein